MESGHAEGVPATPAVERRIVSVLFADLVGFTTLSEQLDPEDVAAIQDAYFGEVRATIERHGGVLEKFIGDAAMAVFGLPRTRDDDAERAVRAGLALASAVARLDAGLGLEPGTLAVRVGVNTGEVVHALTGPDGGRVTGDTVNVAARLQAAAAPGRVLLGEATALAVEAAIELGAPEELTLKGKADPVRARHAVGSRPVPSREAALGRLVAPTIGRERELGELDGALRQASAPGRAAIRLVVAPPGVGKSRLLAEWRRRIRDRSAGSAAPWPARVRPDVLAPDAVVGQLVSAAIDRGAEIADLRARLAAGGLSPARAEVVAAELGAAVAGRAGVESDRERRFLAWLEGLDALADGPAVWLVEDVHWAGADLIAFLVAAARTTSRRGRLVVATARPSVLERAELRAAPDGGGLASDEHLPLAPLPEADAAALVRALVGDALPPAVVADIAERSDGTPLFVEELLRTWIAVGVLVAHGDRWRLTRTPEALALPQTVQALYGAQLDELPAAARSVAVRGSVAGRSFPETALDSLHVREAAQGVAILSARTLVVGPTDEPRLGPSFAYRHALLRDAAYASLARAERAELHVRMAEWLVATAGEATDEVAELVGGHYEQALRAAPALARHIGPDLDRTTVARLAAAWLEQAAEATMRGSAHAAARVLAERALAATPDGDEVDGARRRALLGRVLVRSDDMRTGVAHLEHATERLRAALAGARDEERQPIRDIYASVVAWTCAAWYETLRFAEGVALADRALRDIGVADDAATARLRVARSLSHLGATNEGTSTLPLLDRALATARSAGDRGLELDALDALARVRTEAGGAGADDWHAVAVLARELGQWDRHVAAKVNAALHLMDDRPADAAAELAAAGEIAEARGLHEPRAWIGHAAAEAAFLTGEWAAALAHAEAALALAEAYGYGRVAVRTWFVVAPMAAARGDRELLRSAGRWFEEREGTFPDSPYGTLMHTALALHLADAGVGNAPAIDLDRMLPAFDLPYDDASWVHARERVVAALRDLDGGTVARKALVRVERAAAAATPNRLGRGSIHLLRAELGDADPARARRHAAEAARLFREAGAAPWLARALRRLAALGAASERQMAEADAIEARLQGRSG